MIDKNERKLLQDLTKIRFIDSDCDDEYDRKIEIQEKAAQYEDIVYGLSDSTEIVIIPYLCDIAEDRASESGPVEFLMKVIFKIAKTHIEEGIKYIILGTVSMIPKAYYKAIHLHALIINDKEAKETYIKVINNCGDEERTIAKMLFLRLKKMFKDNSDIDDILNVL